jgi:ribosome-associated protein
MITITPTISLDEKEIQETFVRASGPGGQNVNKVSTAVQLRFDVRNSASLPAEVKHRLIYFAGKRLSNNGILIITAQKFRTQEKNRQDALNRLIALIRQAARKPKSRKPTQPPESAKEQRLAEKQQRSETKQKRGRVKEAGEESEG